MCITQFFKKKNNTFIYLLIHHKMLIVFSGSGITDNFYLMCVFYSMNLCFYIHKENKGIIKNV